MSLTSLTSLTSSVRSFGQSVGRLVVSVASMHFVMMAIITCVWVLAHMGAAHAYAHFCAPIGIVGFFKTLIYAPAPHCIALSWIVMNARSHIINTWSLLGVLVASRILSVKLSNLFPPSVPVVVETSSASAPALVPVSSASAPTPASSTLASSTLASSTSLESARLFVAGVGLAPRRS